MSDIEFRFVQPNEFADYYYEHYDGNNGHVCDLWYEHKTWHVARLRSNIGLTEKGLIILLNKIKELNATTKPKNRFGF